MKKLTAIFAICFTMFAVSLFAQDDPPVLDLALDATVGYGSMFGEEAAMFAQDAQFAVLGLDILGVDLFNSKSGVMAEVQFGGGLEYQVWSANRAVVPGTNGRLYGGSDLKLIQSTNNGGVVADFDLRFVTGYVLGIVGPGSLNFEVRFAEENRPTSFALSYGF